VDVRIGITQAPRELTVEMPDDERDETVPAAKIAYVEVGTSDGDRRIGFG
jgi:hypothetical protein